MLVAVLVLRSKKKISTSPRSYTIAIELRRYTCKIHIRSRGVSWNFLENFPEKGRHQTEKQGKQNDLGCPENLAWGKRVGPSLVSLRAF